MKEAIMYQYLLIDGSERWIGELTYDKPVTEEQALRYLRENSFENPMFVRFAEQECRVKNSNVRFYLITYQLNQTPGIMHSFTFETGMHINAKTYNYLKEIIAFDQELQIEDINILIVNQLGLGERAELIDGKTNLPSTFSFFDDGLGSIANYALNLVSTNEYNTPEDLLSKIPSNPGFTTASKTRAIADLLKQEFIQCTESGLVITQRGKDIMKPQIVTEKADKMKKIQTDPRKIKLSKTSQGVLLVCSDKIPRTAEQIEKEAEARGVSNHMRNAYKAVPMLISKGFLNVDNGNIIITNTGLEKSQTYTNLDLKPAPKRPDPVTPDDVKNPAIFVNKCFAHFKAIPNNKPTRIGFIEYMRQELKRFGKNPKPGQLESIYDHFKIELDLP